MKEIRISLKEGNRKVMVEFVENEQEGTLAENLTWGKLLSIFEKSLPTLMVEVTTVLSSSHDSSQDN